MEFFQFSIASPTTVPGRFGANAPAILRHFYICHRTNAASSSSPHEERASPRYFRTLSSVLRRLRVIPSPQDQRRSQKPIYNGRNVELIIDLDRVYARSLASIKRFIRSFKSEIHRFIASGAVACNDLKSSFRVDRSNRIVFSCRKSSIHFFGILFVWSFAAVISLWFLLRLWSFRRRWWFLVRRRDRSLGGREVVVGRSNFNGFVNPLYSEGEREVKKSTMAIRKKTEEKLPKWWPNIISSHSTWLVDNEGQKEAQRLIKAIMDNRFSGRDYKDDDIIQIREICKSSGSKALFETNNARDSFFRAAVSFVMDKCSRTRLPETSVQIDGEDATQFICGLAGNIELDNFRAARLICAAVAARTRSCFLQSWAYEVQGKRMQAMEELLKLSKIFRAFPPEQNSVGSLIIKGLRWP